MNISELIGSLSKISTAVTKSITGYIEQPDKKLNIGHRITIPIDGKPSHYLALTLTAVEFVKLEGLQ